MTAILNITTRIPLDKIEISQNNIRKGDTEPDPVLMASIKAEGLLQNIGVAPHATKSDVFVVVYGFRRIRALRALAKAREISKSADINCIIVEADASEQTAQALAENTCRKAMNPVDEFEAYAKLGRDGMSVEDIAERQGTTVRKVRDRLALGNAAPCVRAALRDGSLSLDAATVYASCPDLRKQERVFKEVGASNAWHVRRLLRSDGISSDDSLGKLIDIAAYEQAGGRLERDLIEDHVTLLDEDIVYALRDDLLRERVAALSAEGWKWVEAYASYSEMPMTGHGRVYAERVELDDAEVLMLATVEKKLEALEAEANAQDEWTETQYETYRELESEISDLRYKTAFSDEQKAGAGCFVYVGANGIAVEHGLVKPEDAKVRDETADVSPADATADTPTASKGPSASLMADYATLRTQVVGQVMIEQPGLALAFVQFTTALRAFDANRFGYGVLNTHITASSHLSERLSLNKGEIGHTRAGQVLAEARRTLPLAFLNAETLGDCWHLFLAMTDDQRAAIQAYVVADQLIAGSGNQTTLTDIIGATEVPDLRAYLDITAESHFGRILKADLQQFILEQVGAHGARLIDAHGSTKSAMVDLAESLMTGKTAVEDDVRARLDAFVPEAMAFPVTPADHLANGETAADGISPDNNTAAEINASDDGAVIKPA